MVDGLRRVSWRELDERVDRLVHVLIDDFSLDVQDCVAILAVNCLEFVELSFAASRARLIYTGLNVRHHVDEMAEQLRDSGARVLIAGPQFADQAAELARRTGVALIPIGEPPAGSPAKAAYEQRLAAASAEPIPPHGDAELPYALIYTSGTTGAPRGALCSSRDLLANAATLVTATETQVDDVFLLVLPRFHRAGEFTLVHAATTARPLVLSAPTPAAICRTIQTEHITFVTLVPTIMKMLADHVSAPGSPEYDLSSLRQVSYGSNPISVAQLKEFARLFRCDLSQIGGATEGGVGLSLSRRDHERGFTDPAAEHILASCGRVQPTVEMRILDEEDKDVPVGGVGELVFRGDCFVAGYHNDPEATARLWRAGWLHTGDLGCQDPEGYVYYVERLGGRIKTGGETVMAREVEEVLNAHAAVALAAVVGVPDPVWGEAVCAVLQLHSGNTGTLTLEDELREHVRSHLAAYKCPRYFVFQPGLPLTALGKIARGEVKRLADEALSTRRAAQS